MDIFLQRNAELIGELSKFRDAEAFNLHMRKIYYTFNDELDGNLKEFTKYLSRYSIKIQGVSWQKIETMAAGIGKSKITVKRYISKLKKLGIIERIKPIKGAHYITYFTDKVELSELPSEVHCEIPEQTGELGVEKTANKTPDDIPHDTPSVIHLENDETPMGATADDSKSSKEALTFKSLSEPKNLVIERYKDVETPANDTVNNAPNKTTKKLDKSFIPNWVAAEFIEAASPFFGDANTITKLWSKATYAARKLDLCGKTEGANAYVDIVIDAFKTTIYDSKRRAIRGSIFDYFFGIVRNKLSDYQDELEAVTYVMPESSLYFNWLN